MSNRLEKTGLLHRLKSWSERQEGIPGFLLMFIVILSAFSLILEQESIQRAFVSPHLNQVASLCGSVLNKLGIPCEVSQSSITSARCSVQVIPGCESIYPTAMLWAAILAYPATWRWRIVGLVGGAVVLFFINIVRVVTMFYIGTYSPSIFDFVHIYAWQAIFILITLAVFLLWAAKASRLRLHPDRPALERRGTTTPVNS